MLRELSWSYPTEDPDVVSFEVYVRAVSTDAETPGEALGQYVGSVPAKERSHSVELSEGRWVGYVVPVFRDGSRGDGLEASAIDVVELGTTGAAITDPPASIGIAQTDPTVQVRAIEEPPSIDEEPHLVQIIEGGADPLQGKLVGEHATVPGGPMAPNASRQASPAHPMEGSEGGDVPATRTVWARRVNPHGKAAATPRSRTVPIPPRPNHDAIPVLSIVGATTSNLLAGSPAAGGSWELDATDGIQLLALGVGSSAHASWTGLVGALVESTLGAAPYFQKATVESEEVDLGASVVFVLECYDEAQRKTLVSPAWATLYGYDVTYPSAPAVDRRGRAEHPEESPWWMSKHLTGEGKPTQPLRKCRWQYVVGASSTVPHDESDYIDYVPGQTIVGRYVRVRLLLVEPTGFHQVICPKAIATAKVLLRRETTSASPEGVLTRGPGSLVTDKTSGRLWHKATGYGNTGWIALAGAGMDEPRVRSSPVLTTGGTLLLTDGKAYAVYLGQTREAAVWKHVECLMTTAGGGAQTAEVGLFSSPLAPNKAGQTLTKLWADGTVDSFTAVAPLVRRNTTPSAVSVAAGVHLWGVIRTSMAAAEPTLIGHAADMQQGHVLEATPGALTGLTTQAFTVLAVAGTGAVAPALRAVRD